METWSQLDPSAAPDLETCEAYVDNPFWGELRTYLERAYDTAPVWEYSRCVPTGWNIRAGGVCVPCIPCGGILLPWW